MNYRFARFLSFLFHPVLMPTYALFLIFRLSQYMDLITPPAAKYALYSIIVFNTLLMPLIISWLLYKRGLISSFNMIQREERIIPYISNAILMMIAYYLLIRTGLPKIFSLLLLGGVSAIVVAIFINLKWKISIHMIGIGCVVGMFFGLSEFLITDLRIPILIALLIAGLIGSARLSLGSHTPLQIYTGFFLGFACEYFMMSI